jgi:putative membrane protein
MAPPGHLARTRARWPSLPFLPEQKRASERVPAESRNGSRRGREIITGHLASKRGKRRVVRRLGRQFEKHHTMALSEGAKVAAKLGIPVPGGVDAEQAAVIDRLRDLRGRRFDRAWLKAQLLAHEQAVVLHQRAALNGDTADVRALAVLALPVVSVHLGELLAVTG